MKDWLKVFVQCFFFYLGIIVFAIMLSGVVSHSFIELLK